MYMCSIVLIFQPGFVGMFTVGGDTKIPKSAGPQKLILLYFPIIAVPQMMCVVAINYVIIYIIYIV